MFREGASPRSPRAVAPWKAKDASGRRDLSVMTPFGAPVVFELLGVAVSRPVSDAIVPVVPPAFCEPVELAVAPTEDAAVEALPAIEPDAPTLAGELPRFAPSKAKRLSMARSVLEWLRPALPGSTGGEPIAGFPHAATPSIIQ